MEFGGNLLTSGQVVAQIGSHAMVGGISAELMGGTLYRQIIGVMALSQRG
ncbi:hypothetical protein [Shewanella surugensis]|uniref:Uncharacterized protein n=1 Tax=Shewanella surugensis TaxID=212020 RepID=A0ABT0LI69_9GAMM|nr:hypothetical protein [Shewanella surugensis]MCL1127412.1 hypothetical protein [Shewanella surugensis]